MRPTAFVLFLILSQQAAAETFMGIDLDGKLSLTACTSAHFSPSNRELCRRQSTDHPWGSTSIYVAVPLAYLPFGPDMLVSVIEERPAELYVTTTGHGSQQQILNDLTGKFGKPQTITKRPHQNLFGATFAGIHAVWNKGETKIEFKGIEDEINRGSVTIKTSNSTALDRARDKWRSETKPKI